jgi:metal-responsive CopG/Arc/MetJ family transcriptional regulator
LKLQLPNNTYESISIDKKLLKDVRRYIQEFHGYRSPTEFIHEAIRFRLLELDKVRLEKLRLEAEMAKK